MSRKHDKQAEPLWRELLFATFAAPAGLSLLATLHDDLDFQGYLEQLVLNYRSISDQVWRNVSEYFGTDWSFISDYLSFLVLSFFPLLAIVRTEVKTKPFSYFSKTRESIRAARRQHEVRQLQAEKDAQEEFEFRTGKSLKAWRDEKFLNLSKELLKGSKFSPFDDEVFSPEQQKKQYAAIIKEAKERHKRWRAARANGERAETDRLDQFAAEVSLKLTERVEASAKSRDEAIDRLARDITIKVILSFISSVAVFIFFGLVSAVLIFSAFAISSIAIYLAVSPLLTRSATVWDFVALPMLFVMILTGYGVVLYTLLYFFPVEFDVSRLALVTVFGLLVVASFVLVVSYNIFAYLYFTLWAFGIYVVHWIAVVMRPYLDQFLAQVIGL